MPVFQTLMYSVPNNVMHQCYAMNSVHVLYIGELTESSTDFPSLTTFPCSALVKCLTTQGAFYAGYLKDLWHGLNM